MILVQNHQQRLSGNKSLKDKFKILLVSVLALGVASCTPKVSTLVSPDYNATTANNQSNSTHKSSESFTKESKVNLRNIALLLPFQLDEIKSNGITKADVNRSALALDFYQGFELGLNELSKKGSALNLNVIDSRDNSIYVEKLAKSSKFDKTSLIVGPVFPKEIKSFGTAFQDKSVLQISPLSASPSSDFNLSNLVSLTPDITAHSQAIASKVAKDYKAGDVIVVFNSTDADSRQFLSGMITEIKKMKSTVNIVSVSNIIDLNDNLVTGFNNFVISGTTDKNIIKGLIDNLSTKYLEGQFSFKLFGHPLWDRFDFSSYVYFSDFDPVITSESNMRSWTTAVKTFKVNYHSQFGVNPSDASFKGYDAAMYFGGLLSKYGTVDFKNYLLNETFNGIYSSYKFKFNTTTGFSNRAVSYRIYQNGNFQLQ